MKKRLLIVGAMMGFTAGCSIAPVVAESVETILSSTVNNYCKADEIGRVLIREKFGKMTYPHKVTIQCAGDVLTANKG